MEAEEIALIQSAQKSDMIAFEKLVRLHDRQVLSIAARYVLSADDAKDIFQEVFIRVYNGLKRFRMESEFATWVHRITVNVCLTHKSRRSRHEHISMTDDQEGSGMNGPRAELHSPDPPADQHSINEEIRVHVERALAGLSPRQRMVFTLKHYEGYKLREIAEMMKCTEGTVKRYLFLATQQLRQQLRAVYE
jgi:RNA polymerase sigma-70 factor, ECF subfamily